MSLSVALRHLRSVQFELQQHATEVTEAHWELHLCHGTGSGFAWPVLTLLTLRDGCALGDRSEKRE